MSRAVISCLVFGLGLPSCSKGEAPSPAPAASASSASTAPAASVRAPAGADSATPVGDLPSHGGGGVMLAPARACRAMTVKGTVTSDKGTPITTGAVLDRPAWLDVSKDARIAVKHAVTGRELVFEGPARLLPCDRGEERFFLTQGRVETATWAGARPGAEVIIATPLGVVRYGDARLAITLDEKGLSVRADVGDAWIDGPTPERQEEKVPVGRQVRRQGPAGDVKALVERCLTTSETAADRARAVLTPPADKTPLGIRAAEHVRARQAARTACAVARAAIGTTEKGPDRAALDKSVDAGEARWRGMP